MATDSLYRFRKTQPGSTPPPFPSALPFSTLTFEIVTIVEEMKKLLEKEKATKGSAASAHASRDDFSLESNASKFSRSLRFFIIPLLRGDNLFFRADDANDSEDDADSASESKPKKLERKVVRKAAATSSSNTLMVPKDGRKRKYAF